MNYWLSWYHLDKYSSFELHSPWWFTGVRLADDANTVCAAVKAQSEDDAKNTVLLAYDETQENIEWRFCEQRPDNWKPFSDRFPKADWMQW